MSDWPLLIFIICGGALILFIGLMNITDLDSFFDALAMVIESGTNMFGGAEGTGAEGGGETPAPAMEAEEEMMMEEAK